MPWAEFEADPDPHGITSGLRHLLDVRRSLPHLHAASPTELWDPRDPGVLLVVRRHPDGPLLAAANVTDREAWVAADVLHWLGLHRDHLVDALTGEVPDLHDGAVRLAPYASAWLHASAPAPG
jgi:amylosucrase